MCTESGIAKVDGTTQVMNLLYDCKLSLILWSLSVLASSILKREKRKRAKNVHFNCVTVYYFTRRQGFTSVPSQGGSTLGMSTRHNSVRQYTLGEFAMEQERLHREMLREHLREEKLNSLKLKVKIVQDFDLCLICLNEQWQSYMASVHVC